MDLAVLGLSTEGCGEASGAPSGAGTSFTQAKQAMLGWATGLARSQGATLMFCSCRIHSVTGDTPIKTEAQARAVASGHQWTVNASE